jgi:hypothetical protein
MKSQTLLSVIAISLFTAATIWTNLAAQDANTPPKKAEHHHYKFVDLGTFGGPASYFGNGSDGILNHRGTASGWADTSTPDPYPSFCFNPDCYVSHAFQSQNGVVTDLGVLPGGASSNVSFRQSCTGGHQESFERALSSATR